MRGSVNGNVLVPLPNERTPLATDPATRAIVARFLAAYPAVLPNRTDINPRALNTNSPQTIDDNNAGIRLGQKLGRRDRLSAALPVHLAAPAALRAGRRPESRHRHQSAHRARSPGSAVGTPARRSNLTAGFDRIRSLLVPDAGRRRTDGLDHRADHARTARRHPHRPRAEPVPLWRTGAPCAAASTPGPRASTCCAGSSTATRPTPTAASSPSPTTSGATRSPTSAWARPRQNIQATGNVSRGFRNWDMQFYAGDTWQVTPQSHAAISACATSPSPRPPRSTASSTIPYPCDCNNFAPLFGFAYRLPGGWGVLRGGYSVSVRRDLPRHLSAGALRPAVDSQGRGDRAPAW